MLLLVILSVSNEVFAIMSKTAQKEQVMKICKSADHYLYEKEIGGYRLNTNFPAVLLSIPFDGYEVWSILPYALNYLLILLLQR